MTSEPLDSMETRISLMENELEQLHKAHTSLVRKVRASGAGVLIISCICLLSNSLPTALSQGYGSTLRSILQRISALETAQKTTTSNLASLNSNVSTLDTKTHYLTTGIDANGYPSSYFTACNVYIQNGLGSTSGLSSDPLGLDGLHPGKLTRYPITNGLGNLIIGYNEHPVPKGQKRPPLSVNGSHNLILGGGNQYSSFGGIIGGAENSSIAPYSSVLNGYSSVASAYFATVQGGTINFAHGIASSVSGGSGNLAANPESTVSGGGNLKVLTDFGWAGGSYHSP